MKLKCCNISITDKNVHGEGHQPRQLRGGTGGRLRESVLAARQERSQHQTLVLRLPTHHRQE